MLRQHPLHPFLVRFRRRLRLRDGLSIAQRMLLPAISGSFLLLFAMRLFPIEQRTLVWIPIATWAVGCALFSLLRPLADLRIAQQVDDELGLKQRLSTSLSLELERGKPMYASFNASLVSKVHQDALEHAQNIHPNSDLPLRINRRYLIFAGLFAAACLLLAVLPNPMDAVIADRKNVAEEAHRQADEIEKTREEIANSQEISPDDREELLRRLAELAEQLRSNQGDREQALADLSRLEEGLKKQLDPKGSQRQAALEAMSAQLQALARNQNPQIGDLEAAAEAIQQLATQMESMTREERKALADQLAQMAARAAQAGDGSLAQALAQMAQAANAGDFQAAQQAAQQAGQALQQAQSDLANQKATNRALSQLQNSRQQISATGQGTQSAQGQQAQSSQANQGQGQGQAQGQGQGQGQPGGGGGTNANTLPPANRTGQAGDPQGQGQDTSVTRLDNQVYIPFEKRQGTDGEDIFVPGQDTGQGETQVIEKPDPLGGSYHPGLVPYNTVYQDYLDSANQAIEQSNIPMELKDYIRQYFSQLEP